MVCEFTWRGKTHRAKLDEPVDLSLPLAANGASNPSAWYVESPIMEPVRGEGFVGEVASGGSVNFRNVTFNPHGHGTHTECLGHITEKIHPVDPLFRDQRAHFPCALITVTPESQGEDLVIDKQALDGLEALGWPTALVVRTLPNDISKQHRNWSNSNPAYFTVEFMDHLVKHGVEHILVDLPSVDREVDGGRLEAHHAFWGLPNTPRYRCTITELVYVPQNTSDGLYLLHLGVAPFVNDASPSRPVLFPLEA
jgi:arylformamidase